MPTDFIERARALDKAATKGPWLYHEAGSTLYSPAVNEHDRFDALSTDVARIEETDADAEFIAAARSMLPAAVEALARVRELHRPVESQWGGQACAECSNVRGLEVTWPCDTATEVEV